MPQGTPKGERPAHQTPYPVTLFEHLERATDAHLAIVTPPAEPVDKAEQTEEVKAYE